MEERSAAPSLRKTLICLVAVLKNLHHNISAWVTWLVQRLSVRRPYHIIIPRHVTILADHLEVEICAEEICNTIILLTDSLILTVDRLLKEVVDIHERSESSVTCNVTVAVH